eukprot:3527677-Rhodomonas_salina.1
MSAAKETQQKKIYMRNCRNPWWSGKRSYHVRIVRPKPSSTAIKSTSCSTVVPLNNYRGFSSRSSERNMSEASTILRQRTGALGGGVEFRLLSLPPTVLGHLWPAERMVVGLRVCSQLRRDLITQCTNMVLVQKADAVLNDSSVSEDFRRLPRNLMLTLKWKEKKNAQRLARVLGDCKALAHLDMSGNQIGAEGAGRLAG